MQAPRSHAKVDRAASRHEMPSCIPITEYPLDHDIRLKRLRFRAWHRGTREADYMIGGFFDARHTGWTAEQLDWFEALLEEQDVDIMGWAMGSIPCPPEWDGPMMHDMRRMDFVPLPGSGAGV